MERPWVGPAEHAEARRVARGEDGPARRDDVLAHLHALAHGLAGTPDHLESRRCARARTRVHADGLPGVRARGRAGGRAGGRVGDHLVAIDVDLVVGFRLAGGCRHEVADLSPNGTIERPGTHRILRHVQNRSAQRLEIAEHAATTEG